MGLPIYTAWHYCQTFMYTILRNLSQNIHTFSVRKQDYAAANKFSRTIKKDFSFFPTFTRDKTSSSSAAGWALIIKRCKQKAHSPLVFFCKYSNSVLRLRSQPTRPIPMLPMEHFLLYFGLFLADTINIGDKGLENHRRAKTWIQHWLENIFIEGKPLDKSRILKRGQLWKSETLLLF